MISFGRHNYWPENAGELCGYSAMAYLPSPVGATTIHNDDADAHAAIWFDEGEMIVAFRGTSGIRNWLTDLDCAMVQYGTARVHRGFHYATASIAQQVIDAIKTARPKRLWLTGHSLGGAMAMRFADLTDIEPDGIYTFGAPRVGNSVFRDGYDFSYHGLRTFRVIHAADIVPHVPYLIGLNSYRHAGREIFYPDGSGWRMQAPLAWRLKMIAQANWHRATNHRFAPIEDHFIATYQALFKPTYTGDKNREGEGVTAPSSPGNFSAPSAPLREPQP